MFLVYAQFWNYHYNLILKHFHHPQRNFVFTCSHSHFLHSPLSKPLHALIPPVSSPRKPPIYLLFGAVYLPTPDISYTWSHMICGLLWVTYFTYHTAFKAYSCYYIQWLTLFWGAPKSLQMVTAAMKLKDDCSLEGKLGPIWTAY